MPATRTEVTEIVTGLAMLGYQSLERALEVRPRHISHVDEAAFERLEEAWRGTEFTADFATAWENGRAFARSSMGLRGRPPWVLEWKGHHKPASKSIETIPADLRVDHVYLISCKYGSKILHNAGPSALFLHGLAPAGPVERVDWFEQVAPAAFRAVWAPTFQAAGLGIHSTPSTCTADERDRLKAQLRESPLDTTSPEYQTFVAVVSNASAQRWRSNIHGQPARNETYWRLMRMQAAPYFVLGASASGEPMRYRVDTPWDFARRYRIREFDITAGHRGQPSVDWRFGVETPDEGTVEVSGHVEVRWSHGKLMGAPEAKIYLDTPPPFVPGYDPI